MTRLCAKDEMRQVGIPQSLPFIECTENEKLFVNIQSQVGRTDALNSDRGTITLKGDTGKPKNKETNIYTDIYNCVRP